MTVVAPVPMTWFDYFDYIVSSAWSPCQLSLTKRNVRTRTLFQWPHYVPAQIQTSVKDKQNPPLPVLFTLSCISLTLSLSLFLFRFFLKPPQKSVLQPSLPLSCSFTNMVLVSGRFQSHVRILWCNLPGSPQPGPCLCLQPHPHCALHTHLTPAKP